jgi:hypothetical protein
LRTQKDFDSIMDTVKYFDTLNIRLDRKTLNLRLRDGKIYKNYYFSGSLPLQPLGAQATQGPSPG